ncbi:MAG: PQQ-dependent sugar dehydrogenase [Candidatus Promineifilaceae bacterium]
MKKILFLGSMGVFVLLLTLLFTSRNVPTADSSGRQSTGAEGYFWLNLETVTSGFDEPTGVTNDGIDNRLFVLERSGKIYIVQDGQRLPTPFLDIHDLVDSQDNWEQGLLGLAFHPDFENNGFFFVNYINQESNSHISRFKVSDVNPNEADPNSEVVVLEVEQPTVIHNGGALAFGPDGYLYASFGDGGWLSDPQNQAQNTHLLLGKLLRLDVSTGDTAPYYTVPADNPFVGDPSTADEIWALGFRNPWRISFDRETDDLYIGDVGNFRMEEVDYQEAGDPGGENYGWRCYEGILAFIQDGCKPISEYTFPIHAYEQEPGCAVTGGYVYRGSEYPFLNGYYVFTDLCSGELWTLKQDGAGNWNAVLRGKAEANISSFGEGFNGKLYAVDYTYGHLYKVTAEPIENLSFSPSAMFDTIVPTPTPLPPGPDLVVTNLTIVPTSPGAGETAEVIVTVQNQGNEPVDPGNNFFIDFYVDKVPVPYLPGVIYWGAQGSQFDIGESRTFTQDYSFTAGTHNLYIQVDTDQSVDETNEVNNIFGPQGITVGP